MNKKELGKYIIGFITSASIGTIIGNAIHVTTPKNISIPSKVMVFIGSHILTSMVGDMAAEHVLTGIEKSFPVKQKASKNE